MSVGKVKFNYIPIPARNEIKFISKEFGLNMYVSAVLIQRLGCDVIRISKFLNSDLGNLHDPFLLHGVKDALNIIYTSIKNNENILIYGDYDVDGIIGVSILYRFLDKNFKLGNRLIYRIANRFGDGYGLSTDIVDFSIKNNIKLIITVDCGTKDYESIDLAVSNKIKVIVTDHHEFGDGTNNATVVINPKDIKSKYPFEGLSGCGVVFKLLQAFNIYFSLNNDVYEYLDLLALSICCDLVPLVDENRILLVKGLEKINNNPQLALRRIISHLKLNSIGINEILFKIGPWINSPGRVGSSLKCVDLFISDEIGTVDELVDEINNDFCTRKNLCNNAMNYICEKINCTDVFTPNVIYKCDLCLGILGILAAKCVEKNYVPSIVMSNKDNDYIVGSIRSIEGIDIVDVLNSCSNLLVKFGGHKMAAGFLLEKKNLNNFVTLFTKKVSDLLSNNSLEFKLNINLKVPLKCITRGFCSDLLKISPFGICNLPPIFESIVFIICSRIYYDDTICEIEFDDNRVIRGIIKCKNINVEGYKIIQYSIRFGGSIVLDIQNIMEKLDK